MTGNSPPAADTGEVLLWWDGDSGLLEPSDPKDPDEAAARITVIDSWLVAGGRTRAFEAHEKRFGGACQDRCGISPGRVRAFLLAGVAQVPGEGRWQSRAELGTAADGRPVLRFRIRPAPPQGHSVRLRICPEPDQRKHPTVKGADQDWLTEQRMAAVAAGSDDTMLLSADGRVLEAASASIMWWRGSTLCVPPDDGRILPGITRSEILAAARASGLLVAFESPRPSDLAGLEVWAVNSLHGIRPVTEWTGTGITPGPANRALRWQVYLDQLRREVRPGPAEAVR